MKHLLSFLIVLSLLFAISLNVNATQKSIQSSEATQIEFFDDGSCLIITINEENTCTTFSTQTKSGTKTLSYKDADGNVEWKVVLHGTYTYTGTTSTCTSANITYNIYDTNWVMESATASKSANTAIGDIVAKRKVLGITVNTISNQITLSCSPTGVLS